MSHGPWVHIAFDSINQETEKALCVKLKGVMQMVWIPLSQIEGDGEDYGVGDKNGSKCITEWFAKNKGLA